MPTTPTRPLPTDLPVIRRRSDRPSADHRAVPTDATGGSPGGRPHPTDEDGSLVTEYGLLAVLGATLVGLAVKWASGGAVWELLDAVLTKAKALVGA